jgi:hypothetical protein
MGSKTLYCCLRLYLITKKSETSLCYQFRKPSRCKQTGETKMSFINHLGVNKLVKLKRVLCNMAKSLSEEFFPIIFEFFLDDSFVVTYNPEVDIRHQVLCFEAVERRIRPRCIGYVEN